MLVIPTTPNPQLIKPIVPPGLYMPRTETVKDGTGLAKLHRKMMRKVTDQFVKTAKRNVGRKLSPDELAEILRQAFEVGGEALKQYD